MGIQYQCHDDGHILHGFSNVDWASDKGIWKSTFEYYFLLMGGVVSQASFLKTSIALSSIESEYMALLKIAT